jgi:hypothetical protein
LGFSIIIPVKEINDYVLQSVPITLRIDYTRQASRGGDQL